MNAGATISCSIDVDPILTSGHKYNFPTTKQVLLDLTTATAEEIATHAGHYDGVVGGPPCQGFSDIGRRDGSDPRRNLLGHFFRLVSELRPSFFIMENVAGLMKKRNQATLAEALSNLEGRYDLLDPFVLDASDYGCATKRSRVFIVGYDPERINDLQVSSLQERQKPPVNVRDAISDLGHANWVEDRNGFDVWKLRECENLSDYARALRAPDSLFTGNQRTKHSRAVEERFERVEQGKTDRIGRHPRLAWGGQCPTLRAGTGKDIGSYQSVRPIHPTEPRVITVREAARLQGFPDAHQFHPTIWHSFRMIGNSVPPILATTLIRWIIEEGAGQVGALAAE